MSTSTEAAGKRYEVERDERSVHRRMQHFVEKWTVAFDLNKRDSAEFMADLTIVMQAVHRDASRETHALLAKSLAAMPPPVFVQKSTP